MKLQALCILPSMAGALYQQSGGKETGAQRLSNDQDEATIRLQLAEGLETAWNSHQPAGSVTPDRCIDDAVFINTGEGWVKGRENFAEMISRLRAPGGPFHDHTRRHIVEHLRFIRPDVAFAIVKTFEIRRAGVPTNGEETRGLIILSKKNGHWNVNAIENTKIQAIAVRHP